MRVRAATATPLAILMLALAARPAEAAPSAPQNLTATVSGDTIFLVWAAPPTAILGYRIEAGLTPGATIAGRIVGPTPGPVTGFTATPIPSGTYYVRVYAFDGTGISGASNEVVAVVNGAGCAAAPAPPTNLTSDVNGSVVTLTWRPGRGGCPATSYALQAGSSPGASNLAVVTLPATVLGTAAAPGVYYVRVLAQNGALASAPSSEIVVTVGAGAPPPGARPVPGGADQLFGEGVALFDQGRFVEARARFVQVVAVDPQRAEAFYRIGLIDTNTGDFVNARAAFTQYLVLSPNGPRAAEVRLFLAQIR